mgnify:CR=1 FL=1
MRKILIFAFVAISLLLLTSTASASWWNVNWKYRREITITNVNGTLTDYQILVELNSSNFNFSHTRENGSDIRFVASDDETLLNHWIEVWNSTNHSAKIWVNVSEITEGTKIFMYYGNESASDVSDVSATFIRVIDGVVGAWHFDEGEGNITHDTSGEGNDGTIYGGANWTDGKFGKALEFDGSDDYVNCGNDGSLQLNESWSISLWFLVESFPDRVLGVIEKNWPNAKSFASWIHQTDKFLAFGVYKSDGTRVTARTSNNLISLDKWYHVTVVYDGANIKLYVNGNLEVTSSPGEIGKLDTANLIIGYAMPNEKFVGLIDEVLILNGTSLSAEEISDLYNNYGYTTPNYPNKVLVRKYTEPEPVAIVGDEVEGIFTTIASFLTIEREIGANYILWKWSCTNPDALVDVFVDGSEVLSAVSAVSGEYLLTDVNENELHIIKIANSFNSSDYVRDEARTLPPFSFFLALLLTTFVLLVITFATTSTVRVIVSIFTLLFTAFTYKYSIYYASPLSYLLLFAFFFTFALMLVEVLRMLTSTIRKKPRWEEDFWSEWREGGGEL